MKMTNEELVHEIQNGATELMEVLVVQNINLVRRIAHKLKIPGVEVEDRIQDGCIGMMEAVKTYNPEMCVSFSTHAWKRIEAKIRREGSVQAQTIREPANIVEMKMKVTRFIREYIADTGLFPKAKYVSEQTGVSIADVKYVMSHSGGISSLDYTVEGGEGESMSVQDTVGGATLESELWMDQRTQIIVDFIDELPHLEQEIVIAVMGLKDGVSKTMRELDKVFTNEYGHPLSYASVNIRFNKAIDYIKARINGEQIIFEAPASRQVVEAPTKNKSLHDIIVVVNQNKKKVFMSIDMEYSQETKQALDAKLKSTMPFAALPDSMILQYKTSVHISKLEAELQLAIDDITAMGFEIFYNQTA